MADIKTNQGVKIYTTLNLKSSAVNLSNSEEVPTDPDLYDQFVIGGILHFYTSVDGSEPFWMPIQSLKSSYVHRQVEASSVWTINHDLGTEDILVQIYDSENNIVYAKPIIMSIDQIQIEFTEDTLGKAVVLGNSNKFSGFSANAESLTSDTVTFGENEPDDTNSGSIYFQV